MSVFRNLKTIADFLSNNGEEVKGLFEILKKTGPNGLKTTIDKATIRSVDLSNVEKQVSELDERITQLNEKIEDLIELSKKHELEARPPYEILYNDVTGRVLTGVLKGNTEFIRRENEFKESKQILKEKIMSRDFMRHILKRKSKKSIFIESGTTLANISLAMFSYYSTATEDSSHGLQTPLRIYTNNAMVDLISMFENDISSRLLEGTPSNQYGATYGNPTNPNECDAKAVKEFLTKNRVNTIFSTASFLDFHYGTHVSSIPNHQLKRECNDYNRNNEDCEDYFFIAAEKITNDISKNIHNQNCKLIFSDDSVRNVDTLSHSELGEISERFHNFLKSGKTKIITGSPNTNLLKYKVQGLKDAHKSILGEGNELNASFYDKHLAIIEAK